MNQIPKTAIDLILESEGIDQPGVWPEGESGITLGYGCDIGADPASLEFWRGVLSDDQIERLESARGKTGGAAASIAHQFRDIRVSKEQALDVFTRKSLPREMATTAAAFPGSEDLPGAAFGALVSLVYNRGTALNGPRRREMLAIHNAIANSKPDEGETNEQRVNSLLRFIAGQFRSMKRLWGNDQRGLLVRRDSEAKLIESAIV